MAPYYPPDQLNKYYKEWYLAREKTFKQSGNLFIIRALGGLTFIQNEAFNYESRGNLQSCLRIKQLATLCLKKRAKLRRNTLKRIMDFSFDETASKKDLKLSKIEKTYLAAIKKLKKNKGIEAGEVEEDLLLLALVFDKMYVHGIPSNAGELLKAMKQVQERRSFVKGVAENVPERLKAIKAHTEAILCLIDTSNFKRVHHCQDGCHPLPPPFSTMNTDEIDSEDSVYASSSREFFVPSLHFPSNPEVEKQRCSQVPHPPFPPKLIWKIRQTIVQLISAKPKYFYGAWKCFQGLCNPVQCFNGYKCHSVLHILKALEGCYFGAKLLLVCVDAWGKNVALAAMDEELRATGSYQTLKLSLILVSSGSS